MALSFSFSSSLFSYLNHVLTVKHFTNTTSTRITGVWSCHAAYYVAHPDTNNGIQYLGLFRPTQQSAKFCTIVPNSNIHIPKSPQTREFSSPLDIIVNNVNILQQQPITWSSANRRQ